VAWICFTPFSWSWTEELSPPSYGEPHVTTEPPSRIAAKARSAAWTETTAKWCMAPCNNSVTIAAQNKSCYDLVPVFKPSLESLRSVNGSAKWQALKSGVLKPASQELWSPLGGLSKWKALTATAGQSYSHLNHEVIERKFLLKIATLPCAPTNLEPMPATLRGICG
jgi:hypothetical protein